MRVADFDYTLPPECIATKPAEPRDSAKLLVVERSTGKLHDTTIADIANWLPGNTTIIANNSRVRHGRVYTEAGTEVLILEKQDCRHFICIGKGKTPAVGSYIQLVFGDELVAVEVTAHHLHPSMHTFTISFPEGVDGELLLQHHGSVPLPHYIAPDSPIDPERYQTTFSKEIGSAAAPTAGLHFTPEHIATLENAGHHWHEVTLHVGLGTFLPLRHDTLQDNSLHTEATYISDVTASAVTKAVQINAPLLAVGTTSLRTLEGNWSQQTHSLHSGAATVSLFITPGDHIQTASHLLTNFHLPKSSLLVLVTAFAMHNSQRQIVTSPEDSLALILRAYQHAIDHHYHFYSLGDAMLLI